MILALFDLKGDRTTMLDKTNDPQSFSGQVRCAHALIDAAANNRAEEVYSVARQLCAFDGAGRTIISASPVQESDGTISIGAFFKPLADHERFPPPKHARRFDVLPFAAMRLMDKGCVPNTGQGFFYQALPRLVDGVQKYYLRFGNGGRGPGARVYATRIIVDAGSGEAARFAEEHHSYRRRDLMTVAQRNPRLPKGELGREQAIKLAVEMFWRQFSAPGRDGVSAFEYEAVLRDLLKFADAFHGDGGVASGDF